MNDSISPKNTEEFRAKINKASFFKTISMEITSVDKRGSVIQIKTSRKHRNSWGTIHGGIVASIADSACGTSVWPHLKQNEIVATISLHVEYIAPVTPGDMITARGKIIQQSRKLARAEAILRNQDEKVIAKAYATFMKSAENTKKS
jgi:acyl-CoA thioesterase